MKKRLPALLLAICMLILPGCARGDSPLFPGFNREEETQPQRQPQVEEQAKDNFRNSLGISQSMMEDMVVSDVQDYGDETIVRYAQTYRGVEIYGSSLMSSSADEEFLEGTYYDLSEAFDDTFDAQVAEASQVPEWMTAVTYEGETLTYSPDTLRAVIYITPNNTAVVAREFEITLSSGDLSCAFRLVTDIPGTVIYTYECLFSSYESATITNDGQELEVIAEGNQFYAYNEEHNYYVFHTDSDKGIQDNYIGKNGAQFDLDLMYSTSKDHWDSGRAEDVFNTMLVYNDVAAWYRDTFGYVGIDGKGGTGVLVIKGQFGSIAQNKGEKGYIIVAGTDKNGVGVIQAPEILAHEYGHAVFRNICGLKTTNEQAALHEGLADTFGALYLGDGSWHIGTALADIGGDRNIPSTSNKTYSDYQYDDTRDYTDNEIKPEGLESWDIIQYHITQGTTIINFETDLSTLHCHENGEIISHTLYQVWKKVFNKNDVEFGQVLFRSLRYLSANATFAEFREAFLYAMRLSYPPEKVAAAQGCFSNAGIEQPEKGNIVYIEKQTAGSSEVSMLDMASMTYGELSKLTWDQFFTIEIEENTWSVQGYIGECYYIFHFDGTAPDTEGAIPWLIIGKDLRPSGRKLNIDGNIRCGMTYAEVDAIMDLPPLQIHQMGWGAAYYPPGFAVGLHFDGDETSGVLFSAEITPYG